jgi:xanthine dehydrogenase accessory factor
MTHDHVEDLAIVEARAAHRRLGSIGLIGSRSKWARFSDAAASSRFATRRPRAGHDADRHRRHPLEGARRDRGERRGRVLQLVEESAVAQPAASGA